MERAARLQWHDEPPYGGDILVAITYFFDGPSLDVDNVPKPVLDALKGLIYADDSQVTDLLCRKRDVDADLRLEENASSVLLAALAGRDEFLHVVVADAPSQEVGAW